MFWFFFENQKHQEFQLTNSPLFKGYHFYITMADQNPAHRLNYGEEKALMPEGNRYKEDLNLPGRAEYGGILFYLLFFNEAKVCPPQSLTT